MNRIWLGVGALTGAAVLGVMYLTASRWMMKIVLGREKPKHMDRGARLFSGSKLLSEHAEEISIASRRLEQEEGFESVSLTARDGVRLAGHWREHPNPKRVIVAMHGWRSSWSRDFGFIADFWYRQGCSVLFAEQRGQNNSGGEYMGFGMLERHDCVDWVRWVNRRCGADLPVYLWGISMGGATVLMASGLNLPNNVKGIISDCGFTSPHAIWKHVTEKNLHLPYLLQGVLADRWCRKNIHVGAKTCTTVEALRKTRTPVLLIHGTEDKFVPVRMTYENYQACSAPKRLFIVPGAEHGMSYHLDPSGYRRAVTQFWEEFQ